MPDNYVYHRGVAHAGSAREREHVRGSNRLRVAGALLLMAVAGVVLRTGGASAWAATTTQTFLCTKSVQTWTVPAGVTSATFDVFGAAGGGTGTRSDGGEAEATLTVTPGATVQINVGCAGGNDGTAGFNGGGQGGGGRVGFGGGGGGGSDVRMGPSLADRMLIAGGGGGSGELGAGGAGGGTTGADGTAGNFPGSQGTGGTQSVGGSGGLNDPANSTPAAGQDGVVGLGGDGGGDPSPHENIGGGGGGGGGGYFGGGGGAGDVNSGGAGGGGSGFGPAGTTFKTGTVSPAGSGNGEVVITYTAPTVTTTTGGTPIPSATQPHTGEPWAGSRPYLLAMSVLGVTLLLSGGVLRRRRQTDL